jgi:hypothetical protein
MANIVDVDPNQTWHEQSCERVTNARMKQKKAELDKVISAHAGYGFCSTLQAHGMEVKLTNVCSMTIFLIIFDSTCNSIRSQMM